MKKKEEDEGNEAKEDSQKNGVQQVDNMRWQRARTNDGQRLEEGKNRCPALYLASLQEFFVTLGRRNEKNRAWTHGIVGLVGIQLDIK